MARLILSLVSFLCISQALAAPITQRAVSSRVPIESLQEGELETSVIQNIFKAQTALAGINSITDVSGASITPLLTAQLALENVSDLEGQLGKANLFGTPVANNTPELIVSGLQSAQQTLANVTALLGSPNHNTTVTSLAQASSLLTQAISSAQQALSLGSSAGAASVSDSTAFPEATALVTTASDVSAILNTASSPEATTLDTAVAAAATFAAYGFSNPR